MKDRVTRRAAMSGLVTAVAAPGAVVGQPSASEVAQSVVAPHGFENVFATIDMGIKHTLSGQYFWTIRPLNLYINRDGEAVIVDELATISRSLGAFGSPLIEDESDVKNAIASLASSLSSPDASEFLGTKQAYAESLGRTVGGKFSEYVSITDATGVRGDYEGVANEGTDNTPGIQATFDFALQQGQSVLIPSGRFRTTAPIEIKRPTNKDPINGGMFGISLEGGGPASCQIVADHNGAAVSYRGGDGAGWHTYFRVNGIGFLKSLVDQADGSVALKTAETAYFSVEGCDFYGFDYGMFCEDILSSDVLRNSFRGNNKGFRFLKGRRSHPNALNLFGNKIINNLVYGGYIGGGSSINIIGGSIESNGFSDYIEDKNSWGIRIDDAGYEGAVGLNMQGVYLENNNGIADVYIKQDIGTVNHNISGCSFMRFDDARRVKCNILQRVAGTGTKVTVSGCGFKSLPGYTDSYSRPFIGGSDFSVIDGGNIFCDVAGGSVGLLKSVFDPCGEWQGNVGADGSGLNLPFGWTSSRSSNGVYILTHNLRLENNSSALTVTAMGGSGLKNARFCSGYAHSRNSFEVYTVNAMGAATDSAFSFRLARI